MGWNLKKKFSRSLKKVGGVFEDLSGKTAAKIAEQQAVEQQAIVDKQEAEIAAKQKTADEVAEERKKRLSQQQLLSGTEQGIMKTTGSLLSGSR